MRRTGKAASEPATGTAARAGGAKAYAVMRQGLALHAADGKAGRTCPFFHLRRLGSACFRGGRGATRPPMANETMLIIETLTHVYPGGVKALDDVSLTIPRGMFGLLGPNGAGKSTLMRIVATLQAPTAGFVRFDGIDVLKEPDALRRKLGYLPQDFGVYPRVSAIDMLDHIAVLKGLADRAERKAVVEGLLSQVNLWDVRKKALSGFSG